MRHYTRDIARHCPGCNESGCLEYIGTPVSQRTYTYRQAGSLEETEVIVTEEFEPTRDYECRNCDCEFILVVWE